MAQKITFEFSGSVTIEGLLVRNGFGQARLWRKNGRVREMQVGDQVIYLDDRAGPQWVALNPPVTGRTLELSIRSAVPGEKYQDTCIAEIGFEKNTSYRMHPSTILAVLRKSTVVLRHGGMECELHFQEDGAFLCEVVPCGGPGCPVIHKGNCSLQQTEQQVKKKRLQCELTATCRPDSLEWSPKDLGPCTERKQPKKVAVPVRETEFHMEM